MVDADEAGEMAFVWPGEESEWAGEGVAVDFVVGGTWGGWVELVGEVVIRVLARWCKLPS